MLDGDWSSDVCSSDLLTTPEASNGFTDASIPAALAA
jgi:hypothetical protein